MPEETLKQVVDRVKAAKTAIGNAIVAKNGTVGANDGLEEFAADIATIPSGAKLNNISSWRIMSGIEEVYVPSGVTQLAYGAFQNAINLKKVVLPDTVIDTTNFPFAGCTSLIDVTLSQNMTTLGYQAFANCTALEQIVIPASMTSMYSNSFEGCTNLTTITVNKPEGSLSGAPWGAPNATVVWTG